MRFFYRAGLILLGLSISSGCFMRPAASMQDGIPKSHVEQCRSLCASANMKLQSIVVIADRTGCVCGPGSVGAAAASGGALAVMLQKLESTR